MKRLDRGFLLLFVVFAAIIVSTSLISYSADIELPMTGQTVSIYPGDDGTMQAGFDWVNVPLAGTSPSGRFTCTTGAPLGDTCRDELTGLLWTRDAEPYGGTRSFYQGLTYANGLVLGGCTTWRMPNMLEIQSLIHHGEASSVAWLTGEGFTDVQSANYWVSSTYVNQSSGWSINMVVGTTGFWHGLSQQKYVWPVCEGANGAATAYPSEIRKSGKTTSAATGDDGDLEWGVAWPSPRWEPSYNGTFTDNLTDLMFVAEDTLFAQMPGSPTLATWQEALDWVAAMNAVTRKNYGFTDWRLPNLKELYSLTHWEASLALGLIDTATYENIAPSAYWTSTYDPSLSDPANILWFGLGGRTGSGVDMYSIRSGTGNKKILPVRDAATAPYELGVGIQPPGSGTVTGGSVIPCGGAPTCEINCPGVDCDYVYPGDQLGIVLTPTPSLGSTFDFWTGCDFTDTPAVGQCTMDVVGKSRGVLANFKVPDIRTDPLRVVSFGAVDVGDTVTRTITYLSYERTPYNIQAMTSLPGAPFTITGGTCDYTGGTTTLAPIGTWEDCTDDGACSDYRRGSASLGSTTYTLDLTPASVDGTADLGPLNNNHLVPGFTMTAPTYSYYTGGTYDYRTSNMAVTVLNGRFYAERTTNYAGQGPLTWYSFGTVDYETGNVDVTLSQPAVNQACCTTSWAYPVFTGAGPPEGSWSTRLKYSGTVRTYDFYPNDFSVNPAGPAQDACTIIVQYAPTSADESMDTLDIPGLKSVALVGTATAVGGTNPDIAVSSYDLNFYNVEVAYSFDESITVTNEGTAGGLVINSVSAPSLPAFTILSEDCTTLSPLAMAATCTIDVRYTGPGPVVNNSSFTIDSNDPDEGIVTINLNGSAVVYGNDIPDVAPVLQAPLNGAIVASVQMDYDPGDDTMGDICIAPNVPNNCDPAQSLTDTLYFATDPAFQNLVIPVAGIDSGVSYAAVLGNPVFLIALFGIVAMGVFLRRKKIALIIVAVVFVSGLLLISCGGHKGETGGSGSGGGGGVTVGVPGIPAGIYYWKVVTDDGVGGVAVSETWSFTVQ